ncbi:hypothetical protein HDZ31DRAFT_69053, partial [Schizophyllum fasciatum]
MTTVLKHVPTQAAKADTSPPPLKFRVGFSRTAHEAGTAAVMSTIASLSYRRSIVQDLARERHAMENGALGGSVAAFTSAELRGDAVFSVVASGEVAGRYPDHCVRRPELLFHSVTALTSNDSMSFMAKALGIHRNHIRGKEAADMLESMIGSIDASPDGGPERARVLVLDIIGPLIGAAVMAVDQYLSDRESGVSTEGEPTVTFSALREYYPRADPITNENALQSNSSARTSPADHTGTPSIADEFAPADTYALDLIDAAEEEEVVLFLLFGDGSASDDQPASGSHALTGVHEAEPENDEACDTTSLFVDVHGDSDDHDGGNNAVDGEDDIADGDDLERPLKKRKIVEDDHFSESVPSIEGDGFRQEKASPSAIRNSAIKAACAALSRSPPAPAAAHLEVHAERKAYHDRVDPFIGRIMVKYALVGALLEYEKSRVLDAYEMTWILAGLHAPSVLGVVAYKYFSTSVQSPNNGHKSLLRAIAHIRVHQSIDEACRI